MPAPCLSNLLKLFADTQTNQLALPQDLITSAFSLIWNWQILPCTALLRPSFSSHKNWRQNWHVKSGQQAGNREKENPQWRYSVTFATDIEHGIQIFWTANRGAISQWTIVKKGKDCGYQANNFSLGNSCPSRTSKDLNAMFNVGGKSNWVGLLWFTVNRTEIDEYL